MFSLSIKQLLRTPAKVLLFILLLAAVTMLLVFGSALLIQTNAHIGQMENAFTTIGMVEQLPSSTRTVIYEDGCGNISMEEYDVYDELLTVDVLDFEGAGYILPPEDRRCYLAKAYTNLDYNYSVIFQYLSNDPNASGFTVAEVIPLEDSTRGGPVKARIGQVSLGKVETGQEVTFCVHHSKTPVELKKDRKYMACMKLENCAEHGSTEFVPVSVPYTSLYGDDGLPVTDGEAPGFHLFRQDGDGAWIKSREFGGAAADMESVELMLEEKSEGFSMGKWLGWANTIRNEFEYYPVIAANSLDLLPSFQAKKARIADGRAITQEEFDSGAMVCLVPDEWNYDSNDFTPGDLSGLVLPISMTLEGYPVGRFNSAGSSLFRPYSFIDENGKRFNTFSQGRYTIVGTYTVKDKSFFSGGGAELAANTVIIPAKSVTDPGSNVVYRGPMSSSNVSFQIPNGSIASFDKKLHEAVPQADMLSITYDDNGYENIMPALERTRTTAALLCVVGTAGAVAVVMLLLYFFVAKECRRTAIERSLGMTKRQCRVSLISGLLVLALIGTVLGSVLGSAMLSSAQPDPETQEGMYSVYSTRYSDWTSKWNQVTELPQTVEAPLTALALAIPLALLAFIAALSTAILSFNLRAEPIELLGGTGSR